MTQSHRAARLASYLGALLLASPLLAQAQVTANDDFTQATDANSWVPFGGACLTAGTAASGGNIPACVGLPYYAGQIQVGGSLGYLGQANKPSSGLVQSPDAPGSGALRLTNGNDGVGCCNFSDGYNQAGAIMYNGTAFPSSTGIQIIFKTVSYRGDSGNGDGADGMSFFLTDGAYTPYDTGAFGGSLGYSCSNSNNDSTTRTIDGTTRGYDGLPHAYLGLGIDEYGNFLNAGDNTITGPNRTPGRIGLRGAGNISWAQIYNNPLAAGFYPSAKFLGAANQANRAAAVQKVCSTGTLWDYSNSFKNPNAGPSVADYAMIPGANVTVASILPGKQLAAESATTRVPATAASPCSTCAVPITYNLKITQNGLLSFYVAYGSGAYIPVITKQDITASNGALPATFRFGFAGSDGGSNNVHEILCFQATPADVAGTSVGVNEKEAAKIVTGTQAYLANYYPSSWTGRLTASSINYDSTNQVVTISSTANWDAQCNLTGVASGSTCVTTGAAGPLLPQAPLGPVSSTAPLNRNMITWNGNSSSPQGVAFEWTAASGSTAITTAEKNALDAGDATPYTATRLNYIRGDRSNEINTQGVGLYRTRDGVLGDIVDSSPSWVGAPNSAYTNVWADKSVTTDVMSENSGTQTYKQFVTANATRLNVVYDGANDGFLHAFRSGSFDANGNYVNNTTTPNDGQEILAYMPYYVTQTIHNSADPTQDYANAQYSHAFFADATPGTGDLFYNNTWHTWLASGIGAGGPDLFILDITNPTNFSEANAPSLVIGDWTASTISCANNSTCGNSLGNTYGTPVIRRLHDGKWAVIFGNGFGSTSGDAGIFVMTVNGSTGAIANTYYVSTATGSASTPNGIAYVSPVDIDSDHITDYVYAGDLLGNVWRFDLTSATEDTWRTTTPTRVFTAKSGQPITSKLLIAIVPQTTGSPMLMVEFGTGRKIPLTNLTPASFATGTQSIYGIWDWNMAAWNLGNSPIKLASLTAPQTNAAWPANIGGSSSHLTNQTLTLTSGILDASTNPICWAGSAVACSGTQNSYGFYIDLTNNANEQVIYSPILYQQAFVVNTTIPATNTPTSCQVGLDSGDTLAISAKSGGALSGFFKNTTDTQAAGSQTGGTGTPFFLQAGGQSFLVTQTNSNCTGPNCTSPPPFNCATNPNASYCSTRTASSSVTTKRLTWVERR